MVVFVLAVTSAGYFYFQYKKVSQDQTSSEIGQIIKTISVFMTLPDESPTLATVSDKEKLQGDPFFQKAQNGDKVLIFPTTKKAILYRPSTKKVIDVVTILPNVTNNQPQETINNVIDLISVSLYNGTETEGLTYQLENILTSQYKDVEIALRSDASQKDYEKTLVVDVSGKFSQRVQEISQTLSAQVASLPEGETKPSTDILIIIGKDRL